MPVKLTLEVDLEPLERLRKNTFLLDGEAILWGIPAPAPMHRGRPGSRSKPTVTTAFTLARVEFGPGQRTKEPAARPRKRRGRRRGLLSKLLGGFRGRKGRSTRARPSAPAKPPTSTKGERPVLRWVAATKRTDMRDGFKAAAKRTLAGKDPRVDLEVLGERLAAWSRARLVAVQGVDTGQTLASVRSKVVRRYGPEGGGKG